jgi:hypothetical protein
LEGFHGMFNTSTKDERGVAMISSWVGRRFCETRASAITVSQGVVDGWCTVYADRLGLQRL